MPNSFKNKFLDILKKRYGNIKKLPQSLSLFEIEGTKIRLYIRYSKLHSRNQTFYGLRNEDLNNLDGTNSIICFLNDKSIEPILIPFQDYEEIFSQLEPVSDGQYKVQIY